MQFKFKQLMISVLPERTKSIKIPGKINTHGHSASEDCPGITLPPCFRTKPWTQSWKDPVINPQDLATLHEQLILQLDKVEEKQKGLADKMVPNSVADIDLLEKHLHEALEDLKVQRTKLAQKTPVPRTK